MSAQSALAAEVAAATSLESAGDILGAWMLEHQHLPIEVIWRLFSDVYDFPSDRAKQYLWRLALDAYALLKD